MHKEGKGELNFLCKSVWQQTVGLHITKVWCLGNATFYILPTNHRDMRKICDKSNKSFEILEMHFTQSDADLHYFPKLSIFPKMN